MKYVNYGLILVVSFMILIGATKDYIVKYYPAAVKLFKTYNKKLFTYLTGAVNRLFRKPTYSY